MSAIGIGISPIFMRCGGGGWTPSNDSVLLTKLLFWGKYSEIAGGVMPNKIDAGVTSLTVAGSVGSETYKTPDVDDTFVDADAHGATDYIWFKTDETQRTTTTAELIGYDFARTLVKYDNTTPYQIREIIILADGATLTTAEENNLRDYMDLSIWWSNVLSSHGDVKGNRGVGQSVWTIESVEEPELTLYKTGLVTPLSAGQLTLLNNFILALKTGLSITNLSDVFDIMYILAGETSESSLKNLVKNASHCTLQGTYPSFVPLEGFTGNGSAGWIDTNYNPSSQGVNHIQNDASIGFYSRTDNAAAAVSMGSEVGSIDTVIFGRYTDDKIYARLNNAWSSSIIDTVADSLGMFMVTRNGNAFTNLIAYKNKTSLTTRSGTDTTVAPNNVNIFLMCSNVSGIPISFTTRQLSFAFAGKYITTAMRDVIVDSFEAYMDANGKGVI
jgi:hypothetical protein